MKRAVVRKTKEIELLEKRGGSCIAKKNAFLYPSDPDAVYPQHKRPVRLDFRSEAITPFASIVKSKRLLNQKISPEGKKVFEGKGIELPDMFMGDLYYTLENIEKSEKKKQRMDMD